MIAVFTDAKGAKRYMDASLVTNRRGLLSMTWEGKPPRVTALISTESGRLEPIYADYVYLDRGTVEPSGYVGKPSSDVWEIYGYNNQVRVVVGDIEIINPGEPVLT